MIASNCASVRPTWASPAPSRRLLQGIVSPALIRRIQDKLPARMIRWEFVNLIEPDPLRRIKLRVSHQKLAHLHPADLADILEALSSEERQSIIDSLDETSAAETLAELDSRLRQQIVEKLDPEKAADIIEEMAPDQAADLLAGFSPETSQGIARRNAATRSQRRARADEVRAKIPPAA